MMSTPRQMSAMDLLFQVSQLAEVTPYIIKKEDENNVQQASPRLDAELEASKSPVTYRYTAAQQTALEHEYLINSSLPKKTGVRLTTLCEVTGMYRLFILLISLCAV